MLDAPSYHREGIRFNIPSSLSHLNKFPPTVLTTAHTLPASNYILDDLSTQGSVSLLIHTVNLAIRCHCPIYSSIPMKGILLLELDS